MKSEAFTGEYWAQIHKRWRESGQEQESYCKSEGIVFRQFKTGVKKASAAGLLRKRESGKLESGSAQVSSNQSSFKRIDLDEVVANKAVATYCEIWFEGRLSIRIETAESLSRLGELVKGLMR